MGIFFFPVDSELAEGAQLPQDNNSGEAQMLFLPVSF